MTELDAQQQIADAMAKRAAAIAASKAAHDEFTSARKVFDDDRAAEAKARSDRWDRERDRQNELIREIEDQIEADRRAACAEEIAAPAAELRHLMRAIANQAEACREIAQKYRQDVLTFVLPSLPEGGRDTGRFLAEAVVTTAIQFGSPSYGSGHPSHPAFIK
jgi:hypothetical protein